MTTIPALQKSIARLYSDFAEAKASIRELVARVDNKPGTSGLIGTAAAPTTIHGSLAGLGLDDHLQYLHISNARTVSADHIYQRGTFNPTSTNPPFTIGINATDQFVNGLNADQVDGQEASDFYNITTESANTVYSGPTSGGVANPSFRSLVDADLPTHDIISAHDVTGSLDQLVGLSATNTLGLLTPSDDPGAAKALLKTTSAGLLTLEDLNVSDDLNVGSGVLIANGSSNIVGINKAPTSGYDLDINATLRTGGLATFASLSVAGAATFGDDLTVGANILFVDYSGERIGIKRAADPQFQLDILGNLRASGWIVGKHAVQLEGAVAIFHFDGREPYESDYTGVSTGHKGQKPITETAIIYRFGKFGKAIQSAVATTNLVINSSWEDGLTNWTGFGSPPTEVVVTTESYYGESSFHLETDADNQGYYQNITIASSQVYNASVYVKVESGQVALRIRDGTGGSYVYAESDVAWAGDGEWHRMHIRFTSTGTSGQVYVGRWSGYGSSGEYYIDAIQLEQYDSITPYCDGSLGSGHSFSGADHASASLRVASILEYSPELTKVNRGTFMCWTKFQDDAAHSPMTEYILTITASAGNILIYHQAGVSAVRFLLGGSELSGSDAVDGNWHHVAITWDGTDALLYLDGVLDITLSSYSGFSGEITDVDIGNNQAHSRQINGWVDEVAFINRVVSADEILSVYESDAPVFAETSTFEWSTPSITTWVDEEGLWSRGAVTGQEVFGISDVNSKSWAGITMDEGDVVIGNSPNFLWWDDSNSRLAITGKIIATQSNLLGGSVFAESWEDDSSFDDWTSYSGAGEMSIVSGGVSGGNFARVGDNSGNDMRWLIHNINIPFDPDKTYKMTIRARQTAGSGRVWAGVAGVQSDGTSFANIGGSDSYTGQHYIVATNAAPGSSWTEYTGYLSGSAATGTGTASPDPTNPAKLVDVATYFRPLVLVNYNAVAGITEVDFVSIEIVPMGDDLTSIDGGRLVNYSVDTTQLTATAIDGMTITGAVIISGGGVVVLDDDGISVELSGYTPGGPRAYSFIDTASSVVGEISGVGSPGTGHSIDLYSLSLTGEDSDIGLWATSPNTNTATIILQANNVSNYNRITISPTLTTFTDGISIASGGIQIGADTQILRDSANKIRIPDSLDIGGTLTVDAIDDSIAGAIAVNTDVDITGSLTVSGSLGGAWAGLSFGTNWSDYGGTHQDGEYKKHGDLVFMRGLVTSGANAWATYVTVGTLPSGYRPPSTVKFASICEGNKLASINISSAGIISLIAHDGGNGSGWLSLSGIVFSVD